MFFLGVDSAFGAVVIPYRVAPSDPIERDGVIGRRARKNHGISPVAAIDAIGAGPALQDVIAPIGQQRVADVVAGDPVGATGASGAFDHGAHRYPHVVDRAEPVTEEVDDVNRGAHG